MAALSVRGMGTECITMMDNSDSVLVARVYPWKAPIDTRVQKVHTANPQSVVIEPCRSTIASCRLHTLRVARTLDWKTYLLTYTLAS